MSMTQVSSSLLPKNFKHADGGIEVSPRLTRVASADHADLFAELKTGEQGLTEAEAQRRLEEYGPNAVGDEQHFPRLKLFVKACLNPLVILLSVLATITFATAQTPSDNAGGVLMLTMVVLGVSLRFFQEARADAAAAKLKAMIHVTTTVIREGKEREIPLAELVPGDAIRLAAGDMIPADIRLLSCRDLFLTQASLTGEAFPVEKFDPPDEVAGKPPLELRNVCFLGTSVESGSASAAVVETGRKTYLGSMASAITQESPPTRFDRGVTNFTWLMLYFMGVMVPAVFLHQRICQARLGSGVPVRSGGSCRTHARDASDDCECMPV